MDKITGFISGLITNIACAILFVFVPLYIISNLDKIRTLLKNLLSRCENKFPSITKYFIRPVVWGLLLSILIPIIIWGGIVVINFIFVRSGAIQGY